MKYPFNQPSREELDRTMRGEPTILDTEMEIIRMERERGPFAGTAMRTFIDTNLPPGVVEIRDGDNVLARMLLEDDEGLD